MSSGQSPPTYAWRVRQGASKMLVQSQHQSMGQTVVVVVVDVVVAFVVVVGCLVACLFV